jgi:putative ABC transport system ATP-binding protein
MIVCQNVRKSFGEQVIFSNLNLRIDDSSLVALTGESGCGKTTLLNMIGAIESVTSGKILVDGIDVQQRRNQQMYFREKVGFLFQNFALVENKTVEENLNMVRKNARNNYSVQEALEYVGLSHKLKQKIYQLSGGEQQRIALARLLIKKCDLVLADEPTGSLDVGNAHTVLSILKDINKMGKTVIIVTHDKTVAQACDYSINLESLK